MLLHLISCTSKSTQFVRLLLKYSAANLLTLHPPLSPGGSEECRTCYEESPVSRESVSGVESKAAMGRGMVTEDDFKVTCVVYFDLRHMLLFELNVRPTFYASSYVYACIYIFYKLTDSLTDRL